MTMAHGLASEGRREGLEQGRATPDPHAARRTVRPDPGGCRGTRPVCRHRGIDGAVEIVAPRPGSGRSLRIVRRALVGQLEGHPVRCNPSMRKIRPSRSDCCSCENRQSVGKTFLSEWTVRPAFRSRSGCRRNSSASSLSRHKRPLHVCFQGPSGGLPCECCAGPGTCRPCRAETALTRDSSRSLVCVRRACSVTNHLALAKDRCPGLCGVPGAVA